MDLPIADVYICDTFEAAVAKREVLIQTYSDRDGRFTPSQLVIVRDFQDRYIVARSVGNVVDFAAIRVSPSTNK